MKMNLACFVLEELADWWGRQTHRLRMTIHCDKDYIEERNIQHQEERGSWVELGGLHKNRHFSTILKDETILHVERR